MFSCFHQDKDVGQPTAENLKTRLITNLSQEFQSVAHDDFRSISRYLETRRSRCEPPRCQLSFSVFHLGVTFNAVSDVTETGWEWLFVDQVVSQDHAVAAGNLRDRVLAVAGKSGPVKGLGFLHFAPVIHLKGSAVVHS